MSLIVMKRKLEIAEDEEMKTLPFLEFKRDLNGVGGKQKEKEGKEKDI
jgi:hypothetical protein